MNGSILPLGGIFGSFNVLQYDPRDPQVTDPHPDHPNQTHPLMLLLWDVLNRIILIILLWFRIILSRTAR